MTDLEACHLVVAPASAGMRLDIFLADNLTKSFDARRRFSRSEVQRLIADGHVVLNGAPAKSSVRLRSADSVVVTIPAPQDTTIRPEALPLDVLYEDLDCIVINKAAGIAVHPGAGHWTGTLVHALVHRCPDLTGIGGVRRPGIVHRLDKDTSGVMIVAKTDAAYQNLVLQFKDRAVEKEYVALVWGRMKKTSGQIDRPIGRHRSDRKRMSSLYTLGRSRPAVTDWWIEESFDARIPAALLRLRPRTGRTHQIRVHLADLGHPLVGDQVYGRSRKSLAPQMSEVAVLNVFPRHALHSRSLKIRHPQTGNDLCFTAPLAPDMAEALSVLREFDSGTATCNRGARG